MKDGNVEDFMFPGHGVILVEGEKVTATIIDAELDPVKCTFNGDECVQLDTSGYTHLTLTWDNLKELIKLTSKAEIIIKDLLNE
jgi:hypothetical protein|tara:strand:- start:8728 stop:8979 length:252 start_codon:yes stop_codon:yes gene_type:complete